MLPARPQAARSHPPSATPGSVSQVPASCPQACRSPQRLVPAAGDQHLQLGHIRAVAHGGVVRRDLRSAVWSGRVSPSQALSNRKTRLPDPQRQLQSGGSCRRRAQLPLTDSLHRRQPTCWLWLVARFQSLTILSQPPVNTPVPSAFHALHSTGCVWLVDALGLAVPLDCGGVGVGARRERVISGESQQLVLQPLAKLIPRVPPGSARQQHGAHRQHSVRSVDAARRLCRKPLANARQGAPPQHAARRCCRATAGAPRRAAPGCAPGCPSSRRCCPTASRPAGWRAGSS